MRYTQPQSGPLRLASQWSDAVVILPHTGVASNGVARTSAGNISDTVGVVGRGRGISSTGNNFDNYDGDWSSLNEFTLLCVYRLKAITAGRVAGNFAPSAAGYSIAPSGSNFRFLTARVGVTTIVTGGPATTALKCDVGVVDATTLAFYENGKLSGSAAHGGVAIPHYGFRIGADLNGTPTSANVEVYLTILIPRALSAAQVKQLSDNPYQVFQSPQRLLVASTTPAGATLTAAQGSYTITGNAATLRVARKLAAAAGAYTLTGNPIVMRVARRLIAAKGTYSITGNPANLVKSAAGMRTLSATGGSYTITGSAATLRVARRLVAEPGAYTITGFAVADRVTVDLSGTIEFRPYRSTPMRVLRLA